MDNSLKSASGRRKIFKNTFQKFDRFTKTDTPTLVKNSFWGVLPSIVSALVSLGLTFLYANLLSKETLGVFKYVLALGGSLSFLTLTGMNNAVMQAVAKGAKGALRYSVRLQLRWNLLYILGAMAVGGYYIFYNNLTIGIGVIILGITFPITAALNTYGAFLAGRGNFRGVSLLAVLTNLFYGVAIGLTMFFTKAVLIILIAHAIGMVVPAVISYFITSKKDQFDLPEEEHQALKRYGQHLSLINIFVSISKNIDRISLFHFAGPVLLATYSIANAVPERAKGLLASALPSVFPSLAKKNVKAIRSALYLRMVQGVLIGAVASLAYWLIAPLLFNLVAPKYLESIQYSRWLSLSLILVIPYLYFSNALVGQKMTRGLYFQSWVSSITKIVVLPIAISFYGIWGLIIGTLLVQVFGLIVYAITWEVESRRHLEVSSLES